MNKRIVFLIFCILSAFVTKAQSFTVCDEILQKYNPSEISRLFELCKSDTVQLSCAVQKKMIEAIRTRDNAVFMAIKKGDVKTAISGIQKRYDAIALQSYSQAINEQYFTDKIKELNKTKMLDKAVIDSIRIKYQQHLAYVNRYSYVENFNAAFQQCVSEPVYYKTIFKHQIAALAIAIRNTDLARVSRYRPALTQQCMDSVRRIITDKSSNLALLSFVPGAPNPEKEKNFKAVSDRYDSLIDVQIIKDGAYITSSLMVAAIKRRNVLKLRPTQVDSLVEKGMYLNKLKDSAWNINPMYPYDSKDFESYWTGIILDDNQLSMILSLKNRTDAQKNAENDWKDMEKRGLAAARQLNKDQTIQALTLYYTKLKSASSMYVYDVDRQAAYMRSVRDEMPPALRLLQYARKNNVTNFNAQTQNLQQ
jgi:hypothetical protein